MPIKPDPSLANRAEALARQGKVAQAFQMLEQGITAGDAYAAATLAEWRMAGDLIRRDLGLSRDLFGRAAELGLKAAEPIHLALLASGAGGSVRHWNEAVKRLGKLARRDALARRQSDLLALMQLSGEGDPLSVPPAESLSADPQIDLHRGFLTPAECNYLIDSAKPLLEPAVVVDQHTGALIRNPVRTARVALFPFVWEDPVIHAINRRIAAATGTTYEQGEPLQVLCYEPGEEYKLHSDALSAEQNQRTQTFLVTLSEGFAGGETRFPRLGLNLRCAVGEALRFSNVDSSDQPDPRMWHAGNPVRGGRKLLLSKWIRAAPLDLSGPPGRPF